MTCNKSLNFLKFHFFADIFRLSENFSSTDYLYCHWVFVLLLYAFSYNMQLRPTWAFSFVIWKIFSSSTWSTERTMESIIVAMRMLKWKIMNFFSFPSQSIYSINTGKFDCIYFNSRFKGWPYGYPKNISEVLSAWLTMLYFWKYQRIVVRSLSSCWRVKQANYYSEFFWACGAKRLWTLRLESPWKFSNLFSRFSSRFLK